MDSCLIPLQARAQQESKSLAIQDACRGEVYVDSKRILQALSNLVSNALDAVGSGGVVDIQARCAAGTLTITICDDGPGLESRPYSWSHQQAPTLTRRLGPTTYFDLVREGSMSLTAALIVGATIEARYS